MEKKGLAGFALRNVHFILVSCLLIIILGVLCYTRLAKDLLPVVKMPAVQILSFYPGMPVKNIEQSLSRRFEMYTGQAIGITKQESRSLNGVSIVKNYFSDDVDINTAIAQTTSIVMSVLRKLPPGTQPPLILPFDPTASVPIALVAVSGDMPEKKLYDFARYKVRYDVQSITGAMAPTVMGGSERQAVLYLDPNKLAKYNFSPLEVLDSITKLNTFIPSGNVKLGNIDYQITSNGLANTVQEMNQFPIRSGNGTTILLNQVGEAKDADKIQTNFVSFNGKPLVYVPVYRQPGANTIQIVDNLKKSIQQLGLSAKEFELRVVGDQSGFVRKAIESITDEAIIGGAMAALLVLLFLGSLRATIAIVLTIPLSFLFAFIGLKAIGQTLNAMTLGGLALSVGVLVDNSIVVIENIFHKIEHKTEISQASLQGAQEVAAPVMISTLCTLIVFIPIIFLQGLIKYLFAALAVSVIFAMVASYFAAMTVIPLYSTYFIRSVTNTNRFYEKFNHGMHVLTKNYGHTIEFLLRRKKIVFGFLAAWILLVALLIPHIGTELFPKADAGSFTLELKLKSGTRVEKTMSFAKEVESKIRMWIPKNDLDSVLINAGVYFGFPAAFTPNSGSQDVFMNIQLTDNRKQTSQYYAEQLREHFKKDYPDVEYGFELGGLLSSALNSGLKAPIDVTVQGPDANTRYDIAESLKLRIQALHGARDVRIEEKIDAPEFRINVHRDVAASMGLTEEEVIKNVVSAVSNSSSFNASIWVDPKTGIDYLMGVQFDEKQFHDVNDLLKIPITGKNQRRTVNLSQLADLKNELGETEINHYNLKPVVNIFVNNYGRDIGSISKEILSIIKKQKINPLYQVNVAGEYSQMTNAIGAVGGGFLLATILVYLLLVIQFRSWMIPVIIISAVPLGIGGIVVMFFLTNTYFSIQAAIGAIFLIGIGVANSVLLVEFILKRCQQGAPLEQAIVEGAQARLRPIMMTALASIMGLVPMAIGLGKGSEANIPLGRAVVGGQLIGVPMILIAVPILFSVLASKYKEKKSIQDKEAA